MVIPRKEHPRPDFERSTWLNLNGMWDFEFDDEDKGEKERWYREKSFSKKILVPFCYQCEMSRINDKNEHEIMWYKRTFKLHGEFKKKKIILNFGAVDYYCKVWINGRLVGVHKGGYIPFKFDITNYVENDSNTLVLKVTDRFELIQPRGKQYWKRKSDRCWYTPASGVWQTVWLEAVEDCYIENIRITPDIDSGCVKIEVSINEIKDNMYVNLKAVYKSQTVNKSHTLMLHRKMVIYLDIKEQDYVDEIHYWTPKRPNLYELEITLFQGEKSVDIVNSYFGMRKISVRGDIILLNNKPYYQKLVLDQGYWPKSLITPPSDEDIIFDIEMTKKMGFNGVRKHQKIEDPRYYYWADKLGLLVWGEMPSGYEFDTEEINNVIFEWIEFIERDYNHPCIVTWVPFNESWGVRNIFADKKQQNFVKSLYYITKALDGTRLISTNDGWEQVNDSDICGIHDYTSSGDDFISRYQHKNKLMQTAAQIRMLYSEGNSYKMQPVIITEYGGIAFETDSPEGWGYHEKVRDENGFIRRYQSLTRAIKDTEYICGYCYTQLTDVMQEVNGLMTSGRKMKVDIEKIKKINWE